MIYAIFTLLLLQLVGFMVAVWWVVRKAGELFREWFIAPDGQQSAAGQLLDGLSRRLAAQLVASAKAQIMNASSINSRQGKAIQGDMAADALDGSPIGELAAGLGLDKMAKKNPVVGLILALVGSRIGSGGVSDLFSPKPAAAGSGVQNNGHVECPVV